LLSIPHLIIIFVVALVVFGPEKLPELARNLGKVLGEFRRATGELRNTLEGHLQDLEREADQRRIGSVTPSATPPAPAAPPEGVVVANAPNIASTTPEPSKVEHFQTEPHEAEQRELTHENVSDGGTRPA
jgi:TatA/E family protein of Tat protein translocase